MRAPTCAVFWTRTLLPTLSLHLGVDVDVAFITHAGALFQAETERVSASFSVLCAQRNVPCTPAAISDLIYRHAPRPSACYLISDIFISDV
eukprot:1392253-Rhodomonas_salina.4